MWFVLPDKDEEIARKNTMIRRSGSVDVATIPSELANLNRVKRQKGRKHPMLVVKKAGKYVIEIHIEEEPLDA